MHGCAISIKINLVWQSSCVCTWKWNILKDNVCENHANVLCYNIIIFILKINIIHNIARWVNWLTTCSFIQFIAQWHSTPTKYSVLFCEYNNILLWYLINIYSIITILFSNVYKLTVIKIHNVKLLLIRVCKS